MVFRKHVSSKSRKPFQLELFSPDDGHYEYLGDDEQGRERAGDLGLHGAPRRP